ncbi:plexin domain-containing protein 2 [Zerene cesonia]|uniref:plexin domain-containing protein 2 n=1 Tax=Zerene cesonia TaxID=33412 RepID=UPI0018E57E78|nr:plexin domain-containing protein 2 [Zerene cesonia]
MKMDSLLVKTATRLLLTVFLLALTFNLAVTDYVEYEFVNSPISRSDVRPEFDLLKHDRLRRETSTNNASSAIATNITPTVTATATNVTIPKETAPQLNKPNDSSNTTDGTNKSNVTTVVTQTPLLSSNTGNVTTTGNTPKVSDPITPDDDFSEMFNDTLQSIKAKENISDITEDHHIFYNSTFLGKESFKDFWENITLQKAEVHDVLSNSHRRATTIKLSFDFPFYGHPVKNITVATGGFIYIGDHVHNWLAATQYIAPLMANFDTTLGNDSFVKQFDDGEKFAVFWENVTLQENATQKFTFAAILYKNGDIVFAYKDIPIAVQAINDSEHPVKVGISDAYLADKSFLHLRRKTIYEYHRVSFKNYEITSNSILKLIALPTCLQYDTCEGCVNHDTSFNCSWCGTLQKCSSGTDKYKQEWIMKNCERTAISQEASCPVSHEATPSDTVNTAYTTVTDNDGHNAQEVSRTKMNAESTVGGPDKAHSPIGGVVAAFVVVTMVCSFAAWVLYAFKNPHTRSGQLLIRYRPSQWTWRRGEARYTAATIHM